MNNIAKLFIALPLAWCCMTANSQTLEEKYLQWAKQNPTEKVYLHLDRNTYYSGETVWFKGYFVTSWVPSGLSSTLYVDLLDPAGRRVLQTVFPASAGVVAGQLDLPETLTSGTYLIRAYSPVMLNFPGFLFSQRIRIVGKAPKKAGNPDKSSGPQMRFFPESGNMVNGMLNQIAFKATDENGLPLKVEGTIYDDKNNPITTFSTIHDGMGSFVLQPLEGSSFYARINGMTSSFPLPASVSNGVTLSVVDAGAGKKFQIRHAGQDPLFRPAYILGQAGGDIVFKAQLKGDKPEINGSIDDRNMFSGILQITVFNQDDMPLAERLTFVDHQDYILPATFTTDTLNTDPRGRNHFSIALKDTVLGNFSVAITDADYEEASGREENIYSWMLLSSDLKGYIHRPSYYFSDNSAAVKKARDLLLMTHGWTRFKWVDVRDNKLPEARYRDSGYIQLRGRVNIEGTRKPFADKDLIMFLSPEDTTEQKRGTPRFIHTDADGRFQLDSVIFFEKMRILFSDIRGKKSKYIKVKMDADSLRMAFNLPDIEMPYEPAAGPVAEKMTSSFDDFLKAEGLTLETVTVRSRQKSEAEKLDEEYASGLFAGGINSRTLDLRNENFAGSIFQYLQGRMAGLMVSGSPGNYTISFRGGGFGGGNVTLYLDEAPVDADFIESIPVNQIAMVKLLPNSVATPGGGTALGIYMKKGADLRAAMEAATDIINYSGYTIIREFYNPDYDARPENDKVDNRITLSWQPYFFVAQADPVIPVIFYNNDRTKRFKIVAEGITNDGRMLRLEKIIEKPGTN
ncbi:Plug domain-containing protein [Niabella terrae]